MPYSLRNVLVGGPQMSEYEDVIRGPGFQPCLGSPNPNLLLPSMACDSCGHLCSAPPQKQCHSGTLATDAEVAICRNYNDHLNNYCFQPVAIETIGVYGKSFASFLIGLPKKRLCPVIIGSDNDSTSACPWLWSERTLPAYWLVGNFGLILATSSALTSITARHFRLFQCSSMQRQTGRHSFPNVRIFCKVCCPLV